MHSSLLIFCSDIDDIVDNVLPMYYFDNETHFEFFIEIKKQDIKKEFDAIPISDWRNRMDEYVHFKRTNQKTFFLEERGLKEDENGNLGYTYNPYGQFDYFEVGGSWGEVLRLKSNGKFTKGDKVKNIDWTTEPKWKEVIASLMEEGGEFIDSPEEQEILDMIAKWENKNGCVVIIDYHS